MKRDPEHDGLYLTTGLNWIYRRLIPSRLQGAARIRFGVSAEFRVNLGTRQREDAVQRLEEARAEIAKRLSQLEEDLRIAEESADPAPAEPDDADARLRRALRLTPTRQAAPLPFDREAAEDALAYWHAFERFRINRDIRSGLYPHPRLDREAYVLALQTRHETITRLRAFQPQVHLNPEAAVPGFMQGLLAALASQGIEAPTTHPGLHPLVAVFRDHWLDILTTEDRWHTDHGFRTREVPKVSPPSRNEVETVSGPTTAHPSRPMLFSKAADHLIANSKAKYEDVAIVRRRFISLLGSDKQITQITKDDVLRFRTELIPGARTPDSLGLIRRGRS